MENKIGGGAGALIGAYAAPASSSTTPSTERQTGDYSIPKQDAVAKAEFDRLKKAHHKSCWIYMKKKLIGAATLSTVDKSPAVRLPHTAWSADAARKIVAGWLWEQRKRDPGNIDVLALASVVHAIENKRDARKKHGCIPLAVQEPDWWRCPEAIQGWLDAFHLSEDLSVDQVHEAFGHGGAGFEQRGKSILTGLLGSAAGVGMLPVSESWTLSTTSVLRALGVSKQLHWDLTVGKDRLKRKPREDLAPVINLKASSRAGKAPRMSTALKLAKDLRGAAPINVQLKKALRDGDHPDVAEGMAKAVRLLAEREDPVKATLNNSAIEWNGNKLQMGARSAAAAFGIASGAASIALGGPAALPVAAPLLAFSVGMHLGYHFADGAKHDSANKLETAFLGRIKSYDWIRTANMTPGEIARLYDDHKKGKRSTEEVRHILRERDAFDLQAVSESTQFPRSVRLDIGRKLLVGKFEKYRHKAIAADRRVETLRKKLEACTHGSPFSALLRRKLAQAEASFEKYGKALRRAGADCVNMSAAVGAMTSAAKSTENATGKLELATRLLAAVSDRHVHDLFCGSLKEQAAAGALERKLKQGEYDKYLLSYMASSTLSSTVGAAAATSGIAYQQIVCLEHWAELGFPLQSPIPPVPLLKPVSAATGLAGAAASTMSPVISALRPTFNADYPLHAPLERGKQTIELDSGGICRPEQFSGAVMQHLLTDDVPGTLEFGFRDEDGERRHVSLKLADTQPHFVAQLKKRGLEKTYRNYRIKTWARVTADGLKSNLLRPLVTYHMRATHAERRELRRTVVEAYDFHRDRLQAMLTALPRDTAGKGKARAVGMLPDEAGETLVYTPDKFPIIRTRPNDGGVDSLFHALGIGSDRISALKKKLAAIRREMPETPAVRANNAGAMHLLLSATPGIGRASTEKWMRGVTEVSNADYAAFQEIPGMQAGYDMLDQYMALPENKDKWVVVVDANGTLRAYHGFDREDYGEVNAGWKSEDALKEALAMADVALYKNGAHWSAIALAD